MKRLLLVIAIAIFPIVTLALKLPSELVSFESPAGQQALSRATFKTNYPALADNYLTQINGAFCGIASLVMSLNALHVKRPLTPAHYPYRFYTQKNIFYKLGVIKIISPNWVYHAGMTLDQTTDIAKNFPVTVERYYAAGKNAYQDFMKRAKAALSTPNEVLIVNFKRKALREAGYGHFSPISAYNQKNNEFLVMDVARYKYPPFWVKAKALWKAMDTVDSTSHKHRGYLILGAKK